MINGDGTWEDVMVEEKGRSEVAVSLGSVIL